MDKDDSLNWYEAHLPAYERKKRGHFSTPPRLVEQILDACGYSPERDLLSLRVLDPACGSGNFLAVVARRLLAFAQNQHLDSPELLALVRRNLWGFDPDPVACFLADMQVRSILLPDLQASQSPHPMFPDLHIHQADALALPWGQSEPVDLFLANPPYLAAKNSDLSGYRLARRRGQADSYLLFLSLALQVVRPGGWLALVLPDPVLARTNAARERQRLLAETTVHHLWHLSGVFAAYVGAVVIIAQKQPAPRLHYIPWAREHWPQSQIVTHEQGRISQTLLLRQRGAELRYLLSEVQDTLLARLWSYTITATHTNEATGGFMPLSHLVEIRRGEELGKCASLLHDQPPGKGDNWYPVLRGGVDVRAYSSPTAHCWIEQEGVSKPLARYLAPKLLVVKSTGRLQAALDLHGHVVLQTLYLLSLRHAPAESRALDDAYYLLALLNSRLLQRYVYVLSTAYKWVQPQIEQSVLARLPIPLVQHEVKASIAKRARALMHACREHPSVVELELYEEQERAIEALYRAALQTCTVEV